MQDFLDSFSKYIKKDDTLILAVSGWVDSMVLLDLVLAHHPKDKIIVAHFDHCLRWGESDSDRELVAKFCERESITFEVEKIDIATLAKEEKMSIEAVARKYRYEFLTRIAKKYRAKYILTAHHQDDRIETAIFNLIRGSKLGGVHALSLFSLGWTLFRPLLSLTKKEILEYAHDHHIAYREDSSNTDTDYLRNHLRKNILPEFEKINPEYWSSLENFIAYTEELKDYIDREVRAFLWEEESFSVHDFGQKSPFFQREIIRYLYEKACDGTIGLSEWGIEELRRYILTAEWGTEKSLSNLVLTKKQNIITRKH